MAYQANVLSVFVSSPSDVKDERDRILAIIEAWNQRNGRNRALFFNALTWELAVSPGIADSAQDHINQKIGNDYDIFLGVMWSRIGSPTKIANSGTEEEFDAAVKRHGEGERVSICFLFKTSDVPMSHLDGNEFQKVQSFKKYVSDNGCLYRDFMDDSSLINAVNLVLDSVANEYGPSASGADRNGELVSETSAGLDRDTRDREIGLFDVNDNIEREGSAFAALMTDWSEWLKKSGQTTERVTEELNDLSRFGQPDAFLVKKSIAKFTHSIEEFAEWGEKKITELEGIVDRYSENFLALMDISQDFNQSQEDMQTALRAMDSLSAQITESNESTVDYVKTLVSLPRLSKPLNKALRRLVDVHERLIAKNEIFRRNVKEARGQLQKIVDENNSTASEI